MVFSYDIFYDRWRSCTINYTFGTLPDRIGAYRYISAITSCDRLVDHITNNICAMGVSDMYNYRNAIYRELILFIKDILINKPQP